VAGIGAVGLRAALSAPAGGSLSRFGQMWNGAGGDQRLAHEKPAGAGLDGDLDLFALEALQPLAHRLRCCCHATTCDLACLLVEGIEGDLCSVHVESRYDRHRGLLSSSGY
jgi:hypothetical protein